MAKGRGVGGRAADIYMVDGPPRMAHIERRIAIFTLLAPKDAPSEDEIILEFLGLAKHQENR